MRRALAGLAVAWALCFGLWFAFGPSYSGSSATAAVSTPGSSVVEREPMRTTSGLAVNGGPVLLLVLGLPVLFAAAPLIAPQRRLRQVASVAAALTLVGAVVAAMSVGLFYVPCALALGLAAAWPARSRMAPAAER